MTTGAGNDLERWTELARKMDCESGNERPDGPAHLRARRKSRSSSAARSRSIGYSGDTLSISTRKSGGSSSPTTTRPARDSMSTSWRLKMAEDSSRAKCWTRTGPPPRRRRAARRVRACRRIEQRRRRHAQASKKGTALDRSTTAPLDKPLTQELNPIPIADPLSLLTMITDQPDH